MKVTQTPTDKLAQKLRKAKANQGCGICPCCKKKNIASFAHTNVIRGLFNLVTYGTDYYKCPVCEAEWESDQYLIE